MVDRVHLTASYARAFMNVYYDVLNDAIINAYEQLAIQLHQHRGALYPLAFDFINRAQKEKILFSLINKFTQDDSIKKLVSLLINHKRIMLLGGVLRAIADYYKERNNVVDVTISTSHPLMPNEIDQMVRFLEKKTGHRVVSHVKIDKALIAGVRLQADTFLWEYSIAQRLSRIGVRELNIKT